MKYLVGVIVLACAAPVAACDSVAVVNSCHAQANVVVVDVPQVQVEVVPQRFHINSVCSTGSCGSGFFAGFGARSIIRQDRRIERNVRQLNRNLRVRTQVRSFGCF